jgi:hypothetical protein
VLASLKWLGVDNKVGEKTKMMTEQELTKEFKDVVEQLKNSVKDTRDCVERVKAVGRKYGLPKELVDRVIHDVLKKQGFSSRNIRHIIHGRPSRAKTAKGNQGPKKKFRISELPPAEVEMGEDDGVINEQSIGVGIVHMNHQQGVFGKNDDCTTITGIFKCSRRTEYIDFDKLQVKVDKIFEIGRNEGMTDMEIGKYVRRKMLEAGYSYTAIARVIPQTAKQQGHKSLTKKKTLEKPESLKMGEDDGVINQQSIQQFAELPMETIKKDVYAMDITSLRRLLLEAVEEIKEYEKIIDMNTERFQFFDNKRKIEEE